MDVLQEYALINKELSIVLAAYEVSQLVFEGQRWRCLEMHSVQLSRYEDINKIGDSFRGKRTDTDGVP